MLDARVLRIGLDPLERRLGARSLDLELRHEDRGVAADALRVDDRPLVREEPEAGEVLDVVGSEEDVARATLAAHVLEEPLAPLLELRGRDSRERFGPLLHPGEPTPTGAILTGRTRAPRPSSLQRGKEQVMLEITRTATFTDAQPDEALTTIVARSVLEAALAEDEPKQLWFEVESDDDSRLVAIDMSTADLEELLRLAGSDDVALTLDVDDVEGLFDDPDVEGHGMKGCDRHSGDERRSARSGGSGGSHAVCRDPVDDAARRCRGDDAGRGRGVDPGVEQQQRIGAHRRPAPAPSAADRRSCTPATARRRRCEPLRQAPSGSAGRTARTSSVHGRLKEPHRLR